MFTADPQDFAIVPAASIPPPHNPSRCAHIERFRVAEAGASEVRAWKTAEAAPIRLPVFFGRRRRRRIYQAEVNRGFSEPELLEINQRVQSRFSAADFAACRYHSVDWAAAAELAADAIEDATEIVQLTMLDQLWEREGIEREIIGAAISLLCEPISLRPGVFEGVNNGQHRTCALKAAGALRVPVWDLTVTNTRGVDEMIARR